MVLGKLLISAQIGSQDRLARFQSQQKGTTAAIMGVMPLPARREGSQAAPLHSGLELPELLPMGEGSSQFCHSWKCRQTCPKSCALINTRSFGLAVKINYHKYHQKATWLWNFPSLFFVAVVLRQCLTKPRLALTLAKSGLGPLLLPFHLPSAGCRHTAPSLVCVLSFEEFGERMLHFPNDLHFYC